MREEGEKRQILFFGCVLDIKCVCVCVCSISLLSEVSKGGRAKSDYIITSIYTAYGIYTYVYTCVGVIVCLQISIFLGVLINALMWHLIKNTRAETNSGA